MRFNSDGSIVVRFDDPFYSEPRDNDPRFVPMAFMHRDTSAEPCKFCGVVATEVNGHTTEIVPLGPSTEIVCRVRARASYKVAPPMVLRGVRGDR